MPDALSPDDDARWRSWKRAGDAVSAAVAGRIAAATGLSAADFSVLTRLVEVGDGSLRQQALADLLGWERSRLSRQVTRMTERGLVRRSADGPGRVVTATPAGRAAVARARPAHAEAVRRALLDRVPPDLRATFWSAVDDLGREDVAGQ